MLEESIIAGTALLRLDQRAKGREWRIKRMHRPQTDEWYYEVYMATAPSCVRGWNTVADPDLSTALLKALGLLTE